MASDKEVSVILNIPMQCRICLDSEVTPLTGVLFSPCLCKGTSAFIHERCLEAWRNSSPTAFYNCGICKYRYFLSRPLAARIVSHNITVTILSIILIVSTVLVVAIFIRAFAYLFLGAKLSRGCFTLTRSLIYYAFIIIGIICFFLIVLSASKDNNIDVRAWIDLVRILLDSRFAYLLDLISLIGFLFFSQGIFLWTQDKINLAASRLGTRIRDVSE